MRWMKGAAPALPAPPCPVAGEAGPVATRGRCRPGGGARCAAAAPLCSAGFSASAGACFLTPCLNPPLPAARLGMPVPPGLEHRPRGCVTTQESKSRSNSRRRAGFRGTCGGPAQETDPAVPRVWRLCRAEDDGKRENQKSRSSRRWWGVRGLRGGQWGCPLSLAGAAWLCPSRCREVAAGDDHTLSERAVPVLPPSSARTGCARADCSRASALVTPAGVSPLAMSEPLAVSAVLADTAQLGEQPSPASSQSSHIWPFILTFLSMF